MKKITLTLELTLKEVTAVMNLLDNISPDFNTSPTSNDNTEEDKVLAATIKTPTKSSKAVTRATAGKKIKMPTLGRTQIQIDEFARKEKNRVEALNEEAELKAQRAEERLARNAEKNKLAQEKKAMEEKAQNEVNSIKQAVTETSKPIPSKLPKKPWEL